MAENGIGETWSGLYFYADHTRFNSIPLSTTTLIRNDGQTNTAK